MASRRLPKAKSTSEVPGLPALRRCSSCAGHVGVRADRRSDGRTDSGGGSCVFSAYHCTRSGCDLIAFRAIDGVPSDARSGHYAHSGHEPRSSPPDIVFWPRIQIKLGRSSKITIHVPLWGQQAEGTWIVILELR